MKEIKDIKIKSEYDLEEKKEILKKCGFEEIDVVLEKFKKENKLKHDILISETIYEKIKRNKNTILVYLKNGEVINRYSEEYLKENSIDKIISRLTNFLTMYKKSEVKSEDNNNLIAATKDSASFSTENILENNKKSYEKIEEGIKFIHENISMVMNKKRINRTDRVILEELAKSEKGLIDILVYLNTVNSKIKGSEWCC